MTTSHTPLLRKKWPLLALVLAAILTLILVIWQLQTSPGTNDTYVHADTIDVVPEVSRYIVEMPIHDNQRVEKGDLLFRINPRPYQAMLGDVKARLTTLDARIMLTQRAIKAQKYNTQSITAAAERTRALVRQATFTHTRLEPLVPQGFTSREDLDQARTAKKAAQAELEAMLLQARQASTAMTGVDAIVAQRAGILAQIVLVELHLEFIGARAPFNGVVVALETTVGQYTSTLKLVFTPLDDDRQYVIANFRETDLNNVRPDVAARITVMTNHSRTFNGVVDSIGSGALPEGGSAVGGLPLIQKGINWVHVSQRFPVKIAVNDPDPALLHMDTLASAVLQPQPGDAMSPLAHFLHQELRDAPGRASYTLRLTLSCAMLIALFTTPQIPFLAIALIIAFYVSQPNVLMIRLASIAFFVTVAVTLGGVLLTIKWTYDYPLIRLATSVAFFFYAIYLMRVLGKLELTFFAVVLAMTYAQTFPSMTSQSEIPVRLPLWLRVAINTTILVTLLVNAYFRQAFPSNQFKARLAGMLHEVTRRLTAPDDEAPPTFGEAAAQLNQLQSLFAQTSQATPEIAAEPQAWRSRLAATLYCYQLAALLQADEVDSGDRQQLSQAVLKLKSALSEGQFDGTIPPLALSGHGINRAALQEMATLLRQLAQSEPIALPPGEVEKASLLAPDAWRNPTHLHFTLKTLLVTLTCYVFYTAADWQGLHTIMLSCVIVARPGLSATTQKTWLRIGGALLVTLLVLLLIVFVQPWTDSLSGLLAMSLPVLVLATWIAAGSERIAYVGIQIGFTFALTFLSWLGPLANLTELRDRVLSILLGVLVSSIVHLYLWPDSEASQLKSRLANLYRRLAGCLVAPHGAVPLAPLFVAFIDSEALLHWIHAEPLGIWVHPWPQAKGWLMCATLAQAKEVTRFSENY